MLLGGKGEGGSYSDNPSISFGWEVTVRIVPTAMCKGKGRKRRKRRIEGKKDPTLHSVQLYLTLFPSGIVDMCPTNINLPTIGLVTSGKRTRSPTEG